ncbi:hypothetical protein BJX99DRAFT_259358 [Aspergillus californicus]
MHLPLLCLSLATATLASPFHLPQTEPEDKITPVPFYTLPTLFTPPLHPDTTATEAIRQTLALYPLAIDGKNFAALSAVFTEDAIANYSAPLNVLAPLSGIQETLRESLKCVTTQHLYGTQVIDVLSPGTARSVTYFQASHFGTKVGLEKEVATAHGQYQDFWVRGEGGWRVKRRNLVYMSEVLGNQLVFVC